MLDIAPGAPINEGRLAAEFGIGRTPIRESLKRLALDHLVVSYPRQGTFATQVDITELATVSEMRQVLEPLAARKAASAARPELRAALATKADQPPRWAKSPGGTRALTEYDLAVHRLIYRAAGNPHLEETLVRLDNLATRIWCLVLDRLPSPSEHLREHVAPLRPLWTARPIERPTSPPPISTTSSRPCARCSEPRVLTRLQRGACRW